MILCNKPHSYRELPIRIAELGTMHRYEASGAVSGLQRVRGMTLNDSHIFVRPDQIKEEFKRVVNMIIDVYKDFGFGMAAVDQVIEDKEKYFTMMMICGIKLKICLKRQQIAWLMIRRSDW